MKILAVILCLVILGMIAYGCAGTTDKVADALNAFANAHETIQKVSDATNKICLIGTSNINDKAVIDKIDGLCGNVKLLFLRYKELSDPVIDTLNKE